MAKFIGKIQGRSTITKIGNKSISVSANSWNIGIEVIAQEIDGEVKFAIYQTGGSTGSGECKKIAIVTEQKIIYGE